MPRFTDEEIRRYGRQILLREVGGAGQERLRAARPVLYASGLAGEVAARYLLRAGIGGLTLFAPGAAVAGLAATLAEDAPAPAVSRWPADPPRPVPPAAAGVSVLVPGAAEARSAVAVDAVPWAACAGLRGEVGLGCPCACTLTAGHGEGGAEADAAAAWLAGSLLALLSLQLVAGLPVAARPPAVLRLDLAAPGPPAWIAVPECRCNPPPPGASYASA